MQSSEVHKDGARDWLTNDHISTVELCPEDLGVLLLAICSSAIAGIAHHCVQLLEHRQDSTCSGSQRRHGRQY